MSNHDQKRLLLVSLQRKEGVLVQNLSAEFGTHFSPTLGRKSLQEYQILDGELLYILPVLLGYWQAYTRYWTRHLDDLKFLRPVKGAVTSGFGKKRFINDLPRSPHLALDLDGFDGDPIFAPLDAKVVLVDNFFYSGNIIVLDHGSNVFTSYSHMKKSHKMVGDTVYKGDLIGEIGSTGRVTGPHLHWVIYMNGNRINPEIVLEKDFPKNLLADYQDAPEGLTLSEE